MKVLRHSISLVVYGEARHSPYVDDGRLVGPMQKVANQLLVHCRAPYTEEIVDAQLQQDQVYVWRNVLLCEISLLPPT